MSEGIRYPYETPPAEGEAVEVAPGVLWLRLPLPMVLDHVNIYALEDGDGWTLVDAGLSSKRSKAIWERLLAGPLRGKPVTRVILTHHHPDHVGLVGWFQARGAEVLATRTAWLYARMLVLDVQERPSPEALTFYRRHGYEVVLAVEGHTALQIFGSPDDLKFHSSLTLFAQVAPHEPVFQRALSRYFGGECDARTLELL